MLTVVIYIYITLFTIVLYIYITTLTIFTEYKEFCKLYKNIIIFTEFVFQNYR